MSEATPKPQTAAKAGGATEIPNIVLVRTGASTQVS